MLAAGRGERFGGPTKQLAELDGRPLVAHAVATAHATGVDRVLVVVGHDGDEVASAAATGGPIEVVENPHHAAGQATSLAVGVRAASAASAEADVAVVLLADQPRVDAAAVRAVVTAVRAGALAARARYLDGPGHPVAFGRACWERLEEVSGDAGARQLFDELDIVEVAIDGPLPRDVDTPGDLEQLREL